MSLIKKISIYLQIILLILLISADGFSRAGGAGGGGSRGGGGFSGGHSRSSGFNSGNYNSYPSGYYATNYSQSDGGGISTLFVIFILIIIFLAILKLKNNSQNTLNGGPSRPLSQKINNYVLPASFTEENIAQLKQKVSTAFLTVQESWSQKSLLKMRRFISDGVYQRFNAQFTMMNILNQTNLLNEIEILNINLVNYSNEGQFESVDFEITASANDQYQSSQYPQFNSPGGYQKFTEYWSFIRRNNLTKEFDIYKNENCPQCSAPLNDKLMATAQCPFCGSYINNGDFDWVLAEITQDEDYNESTFEEDINSQLEENTQLLTSKIPSFSKQILEDKASNAFLQILIALATRNMNSLERFSTKEGFEKFKNLLTESNLVYDRLFLNSVELLNLTIKDNIVEAYVGIKYTFRRVLIKDSQAQIIDPDLIDENRVLLFMHELPTPSTLGSTNSANKGSVYANTCPHCGAAQKDSLSPTCGYCHSNLNDPKKEWVLNDIITLSLYKNLM